MIGFGLPEHVRLLVERDADLRRSELKLVLADAHGGGLAGVRAGARARARVRVRVSVRMRGSGLRLVCTAVACAS